LHTFFNIKNSLSRSAYIGHLLVFELILICFLAVVPISFHDSYNQLLMLVYETIRKIGLACITVQRLNDLNKPLPHLLFILVPIYNLYFILCLLFCKGKKTIVEESSNL
jgi:uncharacterized membrane protein YhaH (DUF805 family)